MTENTMFVNIKFALCVYFFIKSAKTFENSISISSVCFWCFM